MSRRIISVLVCAISLLFAGCAYDEHGRARYADRSGSLKDTHMRNSKSTQNLVRKNASWRGGSSRYAGKKYTRKPVRTIVMSAEDAARKYSQLNRKEKSAVKEIERTLSDDEPSDENDDVKDQKASEKKDVAVQEPLEGKKADQKEIKIAKAEPKGIQSNDVSDITDGSVSEEFFVEDQVKADTREVILPKEPGHSNKGNSSGASSLAMHVQTPQNDGSKTRGFNPGIVVEKEEPYTVVKVYYATDRTLSGSTAPKKMYGSGRGAISYGSCEISIPKSHKVGEIEAPSIWRLEFRENQSKHVVLKNVKREKKTTFFNQVKKNIELSKGKNAFVFVHGYNITFHEAAMRTAQMAHDLKFDGVPIFYSWPSRGTYRDYTRDEANVRWTEANLKKFMRDFVQRSKAENIYLIAHSMGARALTRAVADLVKEMPSIKGRIKEVLLAAPDIDAEVFKRDIAPKLVKASKNVTLYASADDKALRMSRTIHGQPRAGDAGNSLVVVKGIDTIDATGIDTSIFGHNYFAEAPSIISDILAIVHHGKRPRDRAGLIPVLAVEGQYWAFRKNNTMIIKGTIPEDHSVEEAFH